MKKYSNKKNSFYRPLLGLFILVVMFTGFICDKTITVSPPLSPVSSGILSIKSIPAGAAIYLNGRNTGWFTPDSITYLDPGKYEITLKKKYYRDTTFYMNASDDIQKDTTINYLLNPLMYGSLNITSDPTNSQILINDSATGFATPHVFNNLIPGEYNIRCKLSGFRDSDINGIVASNETRAFFLQLQDTTVWIDYRTSNSSIASNTLTCIDVDNNNNLWIGTTDSGLVKFDGTNFYKYSTSNSAIPADNIVCVNIDNQNRVWVGTDNGMGIFDGNSWTIFNTNNSPLLSNRVQTFAFENNMAWIGSTAGLLKYDNGSWQIFTVNNSNLPWPIINTISIDQNNLKWIGLSDSGVVSFDNQNFTIYNGTRLNFPTNDIITSAISSSGNLWLGCHYINTDSIGGLVFYNGANWTTMLIGSPSILIRDIIIDQNENKWVASDEGIFQISGQAVINNYTNYNSKLTSSDIYGLVEDNSGNLWIATNGGGLNKFKGAN